MDDLNDSTGSNCQSPNYNKDLNDPASNKGLGERAEKLPQCSSYWASNNQGKRLGQPTNQPCNCYL